MNHNYHFAILSLILTCEFDTFVLIELSKFTSDVSIVR